MASKRLGVQSGNGLFSHNNGAFPVYNKVQSEFPSQKPAVVNNNRSGGRLYGQRTEEKPVPVKKKQLPTRYYEPDTLFTPLKGTKDDRKDMLSEAELDQIRRNIADSDERRLAALRESRKNEARRYSVVDIVNNGPSRSGDEDEFI